MRPRHTVDRRVLEILEELLIPEDNGFLRARRADIVTLLADALHVSQTEVGESLQRLHRNGWLTLKRGGVRLHRASASHADRARPMPYVPMRVHGPVGAT